jgi:hypothetical protein
MSLVKISQLPSAADLAAGCGETLLIIQNGTNKKISVNTLMNNLRCDVTINPGAAAVNFKVHGQSLPNLLAVIGSTNRIGVGTESPEALFHVAGDIKIGVDSGKLLVNEDVVTIPGSSVPTVITNSSITTNLATTSNSLGTMTSNLSIGTAVSGQLKIVTYSQADASKETGVAYHMHGTYLNQGISTVQFTKKGDSVILYGVGSSWCIIGYNGVTLI